MMIATQPIGVERMELVADEWYRSDAWHETARADFEARLARARPHNRPQYLRIKGERLRAVGDVDAARVLLERSADHPDAYLFETVAAWESLAQIAAERGDQTTAETLYRRILAQQPSLSGTTGSVEISLAELLLDTGRVELLDEALALLDTWINRPGLKFDSQLFRWHLDLIRVAEATGEQQTVRRAAATALALAERGPQLPRHPDVGLVQTDKATLKRLRKLAK
jgi:predicted Zn-dependent protease